MLRYWSPEDAQRQAQTQTGLLRAAFHMLRPGGTLVYSTCSLSLEENEHVLMALLTRYGESASVLPISDMEGLPLAEPVRTDLPHSLRHAVRIWPHLHDTEGAFVARIGKRSPTDWPQVESDAEGGSAARLMTPLRCTPAKPWNASGIFPYPAQRIKWWPVAVAILSCSRLPATV